MKAYFEDIICALATPNSTAALAVVRVSGCGSLLLLKKLFRINENIDYRKVYYKSLYDNEKLVDEVVFFAFEDGKSFTGEESFEIVCHGSPLIASEITNLICKTGARPAEPGEFSYRSYLNGKIDLTKAEGIHHSIHAQSRLSKEMSLNLLSGGLKNTVLELKEDLVLAVSRLEASIDFSDQDIDLDHDDLILSSMKSVRYKVQQTISSFDIGVTQFKGIKVALCGPPNAGKSSLFNSLLNQERSIVSDIAGTTRDYISDRLQIKGNSFEVIDTAGLRNEAGEIEQVGIERSIEVAKSCQLTLFLVSKDSFSNAKVFYDSLSSSGLDILVVETKKDLGAWSSDLSASSISYSNQDPSALEDLKLNVYERLKPYFKVSNNIFLERHLDLFRSCLSFLEKALNAPSLNGYEDVISSNLYSALGFLDEILYLEDPEAVRDKIFNDFCLGK